LTWPYLRFFINTTLYSLFIIKRNINSPCFKKVKEGEGEKRVIMIKVICPNEFTSYIIWVEREKKKEEEKERKLLFWTSIKILSFKLGTRFIFPHLFHFLFFFYLMQYDVPPFVSFSFLFSIIHHPVSNITAQRK
jgi:hypothetical protein